MTDDRSSMIWHADAVEVRWPGGGVSTLPYLWLRDNCGCDECRVVQTTEKNFIITSVPVDLQPSEVALVDDQLRLIWPDGHETCYAGADIRAFDQDEVSTWTPWGADFRPRKTDYQTFLADDSAAAAMIADFLEHGVSILDGAPMEPGTLEELAPRLGPIREVLFDRIHNVELDPAGYNVAHTAFALPPHNDFPSYSWPPSVQALHMLVNETPGGDSIVVDGWSVLAKYRQEHPDFFESLCSMPVPFRMFDEDNETNAVAPMVRCDTEGNIVAFRYSNQLMQAMNPNRPGVALFYRAYHQLCRRISASAVKATFRLEGGEILLVASHRVLHGRQAFEPTGRRHLQDAYYELDNVKNHLVLLRRKNAY